ncbi:hypothetical protein LTR67_000470 [Exophiala xenobiotica]
MSVKYLPSWSSIERSRRAANFFASCRIIRHPIFRSSSTNSKPPGAADTLHRPRERYGDPSRDTYDTELPELTQSLDSFVSSFQQHSKVTSDFNSPEPGDQNQRMRATGDEPRIWHTQAARRTSSADYAEDDHVQDDDDSPNSEHPTDPSNPDSGSTWVSQLKLENDVAARNYQKAKLAPGNKCVDRSILVTGGTTGVGFAVAKRALLEGASHVHILAGTIPGGAYAVRRLKKLTGLDDAPVSFFLPDPERMFPIPRFEFNTLVNCAAIHNPTTLSNYNFHDKTWYVNVALPGWFMKTMLRRYASIGGRKRGGLDHAPNDLESRLNSTSWCCVNLSNIMATQGGYGMPEFAASQSAISTLTRMMVLECGNAYVKYRDLMPPFRANNLVHGLIDTPSKDKYMSRGAQEEVRRKTPLGRFGTMDEVADAVMFLLHNPYANNCTLNLDGGFSAR